MLVQLEALAAEKGVTPAQLSMGWLLQKGKVSFQWKNPDFLFKNPDFLFKNVGFLFKNAGFLLKNIDFVIKQRGGMRMPSTLQRGHRKPRHSLLC